LPKVGDLLLHEIQDTIPAMHPGGSMSCAWWTGDEIQDSIILDILVGYLMRYGNRYPHHVYPSGWRGTRSKRISMP
jgi:hypothetical protein